MKTTAALLSAALVSSGAPACGFVPHVVGPVAWLDFETDRLDVDDTYKKVSRGLGGNIPDLFYRREIHPLHQTASQIRRFIDTEGIVMVVVDSIGAAIGDDPESAAAVLRYFNAVRSLGVASENIDHITKAGANGKPFGSAYKHNSARLTFEQRLHQLPGDDEVHLGVYARKANKGKLLAPFGLAVTFTDDAITFRREDIREPSLVTGMSASQQIKIALRDARHPLTMAEIVELTGMKEPIARTRTNELVKNKSVVLIASSSGAMNKYGLASPRDNDELTPVQTPFIEEGE
jgi:hypothetical protein